MTTRYKRLGFAGIIIHDREQCAAPVNKVLSEYAGLILSCTNLPNVKINLSGITWVIDTTTHKLGIPAGKRGTIKGLSINTVLANSQHGQQDGKKVNLLDSNHV